MKAGVLITARMGSTRLARKHCLPVKGRPIITYLLGRLDWEFSSELENGGLQVVVTATSDEKDREFERMLGGTTPVFYGADENIPLRHFQAAEHYGFDSIVAVDGDDIFCSPVGVRRIYEALAQGQDFAQTTNLPFGMNSSGYRTDFLKASLAGHMCDVLETGWGRIFDDARRFDVEFPLSGADKRLRFTLDYDEDYRFFTKVIEALGQSVFKASDEEIIRLVLENNIYKIKREQVIQPQ